MLPAYLCNTMRRNCLLIIVAMAFFGCGDKEMSRKAKFFYKANDHLYAREYKEAIEFYSEAINVDQNFKDAYNNRGIAYFEQGKYFEAIEDYSRAILIDPAYTDAYFNRANAYIQNQKWERALKDMTQVVKVYKDFCQCTLQFRYYLQ